MFVWTIPSIQLASDIFTGEIEEPESIIVVCIWLAFYGVGTLIIYLINYRHTSNHAANATASGDY